MASVVTVGALGLVGCGSAAMSSSSTRGSAKSSSSSATTELSTKTTAEAPTITATQTTAATQVSTTSSSVASNSIEYRNEEYGFIFSLPPSWSGYSIVIMQWEGFPNRADGGSQGTEPVHGPEILVRHPLWTAAHPRQDIPIMVFTLAEWDQVRSERLAVGAAPIPPSELGRNSTYVFALPARYNYAFPTGYEEVEQILKGHPLKGIDG
jgi:hypothetical protein